MKEKVSESARRENETESRAIDRPEGRKSTPARPGPSTPALRSGDPFAVMRRFTDDMDRIFGDFGFGGSRLMAPWSFGGWRGPAARGMGFDQSAWSPQVEVFERGDRLVIRADLPGLTRDDVQVEVADDAISIRGERRQEHEEHREGFYHSERSYGSFHRTIPLPDGIEADKADASFHDGVLEVTMPAPRREASRSRRLEVKG